MDLLGSTTLEVLVLHTNSGDSWWWVLDVTGAEESSSDRGLGWLLSQMLLSLDLSRLFLSWVHVNDYESCSPSSKSFCSFFLLLCVYCVGAQSIKSGASGILDKYHCTVLSTFWTFINPSIHPFSFETDAQPRLAQTHCVEEDDLWILILLPPPRQHWDYRCMCTLPASQLKLCLLGYHIKSAVTVTSFPHTRHCHRIPSISVMMSLLC